MIYGYARVSTRGQLDGNSLEAQEKALREAGATAIYKDAFTGTKANRPEFDRLMANIKEGDTLIVTKLDRFARSMTHGSQLVSDLIERGVRVFILNIGVLDNTPASKLTRNIFFAFAEYERDMIVERTQEGKAIAKTNAESKGVKFKEGRPVKYTNEKIEMALNLLQDHSYSQVAELTGISKSTLIRAKNRRYK